MACQRAMATGFYFQQSDEPKQPPKYKVEATLPTWEEFCGVEADKSAQHFATNEELNEILYGDSEFYWW